MQRNLFSIFIRLLRRRSRVSRWLIAWIPCFIFLVMLTGLYSNSAQARPTNSAYDVIAAVNQLRAANGLPPYQVNGSLMAAAQSHSEYMAANGIVSHTGSGGSRPRDRAIAAGYGGGNQVYVSENIAGGKLTQNLNYDSCNDELMQGISSAFSLETYYTILFIKGLKPESKSKDPRQY